MTSVKPALKKQFNGRSNADQVLAEVDLKGKNIVITGANSGIGFEAARALASRGANLVLACRNADKTQQAIEKIKLQQPNALLSFAQLDLADFENIKNFAQQLDLDKIDILICNAGLAPMSYSETSQGLESTTGVCHFGHFLLSQLLMPRILASEKSRIVMVSSESHKLPFKLDFDHLPHNQKSFSFIKAYGQAKLCNLLFAKELQRRYAKDGLTACAVHPGNLVSTEIGRDNIWTRIGMKLVSPITKNANQGAATTVFAAARARSEEIQGEYLYNCKVQKSSKESCDETVAKKLWQISEELLQKY